MPYLQSIFIENTHLTSITLSGLTNLTQAYLRNNYLTTIDLSTLTSLTQILINNNQLTDIIGLTGLTISNGDIRYNYLYDYITINSGFLTNITYNLQYNHPDQEAALIQFYNDANGSGWASTGNWLNTGMSYCLRGRVSCDAAMNITALNINNNQISGEVSLTGLPYLQTIDLGRNHLSRINLSGLSQLQTLVLNDNDLTTINFS